MTCDNCGMAAQGTFCATCERARANEKRHGLPERPDDDDDWIEQTGIDGRATGQTTLSGGIRKDGGRDE